MAWPDRELPGAEGGAGTQPGVLTPAPSWPCPGCGRGRGRVRCPGSVQRPGPFWEESPAPAASRAVEECWLRDFQEDSRLVAPRGGRSRVCRATVWKCRLAPPPQSVQKTPASPSSSGLWGPGSHPGPPSSTVCPLGVSRAARGQGRASGSLGSRCAVARSCPWNSAVPRAPRLGMLSAPATSERATPVPALEAAFPGPPQVRGRAQGQCRSGRGLGTASQRRRVARAGVEPGLGRAGQGGRAPRARSTGGRALCAWRPRGLLPPRASAPCLACGGGGLAAAEGAGPARHGEHTPWRRLTWGPPASACLESPCLLLPGPLRGGRRGAGLVLSAGLFLPGSLVRNRPSRPPKQGSFSRTNNEAPRGVVTCPRSHRGSLGP